MATKRTLTVTLPDGRQVNRSTSNAYQFVVASCYFDTNGEKCWSVHSWSSKLDIAQAQATRPNMFVLPIDGIEETPINISLKNAAAAAKIENYSYAITLPDNTVVSGQDVLRYTHIIAFVYKTDEGKKWVVGRWCMSLSEAQKEQRSLMRKHHFSEKVVPIIEVTYH